MDSRSFFRNFFGIPEYPPGNSQENFWGQENNSDHQDGWPGYEQTFFFNFFDEVDKSFQEATRLVDSLQTETPHGQEIPLRDQMLKPGYSKQEQNSSLGQKLDTDLDPVSIPRENFDQLFQTQVIPSGTFNYKWNNVSVVNGAVTKNSQQIDSEGCTRKITTHRFQGREYTVEKRICPGGPETAVETFHNLKKEDLPEFFKQFPNCDRN